MNTKLEYFSCLELKFEWNLTTQFRRHNEPSILSTKFIYKNNELFRIGVKKPYPNSFENVTFFLLTTNLKQLGLKVKEVSFTYQAELDKCINKEMNHLKTSNNENEEDENEVIQLFTAPFNKEYYHRETIGLSTTDLIIHFTVYFIGITENYRVHQIDGLLSQELLSSGTNQDDGTDFKLIAKDGKSLNVHKWILAARSPVFTVFFNKEEVEQNHHVMDCTMEEMNQLIMFIYTGELPEGQPITQGLMQLAVRYQIKTLENIYRTASTNISLDKMATLALHLEPGYRKQQLCKIINIGTCKPDAEFETKFGKNVSFYVCTWNVLPLIKIWTKDNKEVLKTNVPFELDKKRLFRAEFEMRRNPQNKIASFIRIRFLSYDHESINSVLNEVIFSIDLNNDNDVVRGVMIEEPTHDKQLIRLFTILEMNLNDIPSSFLITFNVKLINTTPILCNKLGDSNWSEELWASAVNRKMTDVEFLVGEETFGAHRSLLSARSPVFAAMFASGMKEASTGQVCIQDIDPNTFRNFLRFLYTGMLEPLTANRELFSVADKYRVETLMELCRSATQTVDMDDIINIFFSC